MVTNRYIREAVRCTYYTIEYAKSNNLSGALLLIIGISKVFNNWRNRFLTPFGKVTVIKTLTLPKITHLALVTPDLDI